MAEMFFNIHNLNIVEDDADYTYDSDDNYPPDDISSSEHGYSTEELEKARIERANEYKLASLETLCLRVAASYAIEYHHNTSKRGQILHDVENGPFGKLPSTIVNKIFKEYKDKMAMEQTARYGDIPELFITKHLKHVQVTYGSSCRNISQELPELQLQYCDLKESNLDILLSFKKLSAIKFSKLSAIKDKEFALIAENMKSIRELHFFNMWSMASVLRQLLKFKMENLEVLDLSGRTGSDDITAPLLLEILKFYPNLIELDHDHTFEAFQLWQKAFPGKPTKLQSLVFKINDATTAESLTSLMEYCPDLRKFSINTFSRSVKNVSKIINPWFSSDSIVSVHLFEIPVNITDFLLAFPNISELYLTMSNLEFTPGKYKKDLIKNIKIFSLCSCRIDLRLPFLKDIFYSENLQDLTIHDNFDNDIILNSREPMYFYSLEVDDFENEDCVNFHSLQEIVKRNKNLKCIQHSRYEKLNNYWQSLLKGKRTVFSPL